MERRSAEILTKMGVDELVRKDFEEIDNRKKRRFTNLSNVKVEKDRRPVTGTKKYNNWLSQKITAKNTVTKTSTTSTCPTHQTSCCNALSLPKAVPITSNIQFYSVAGCKRFFLGMAAQQHHCYRHSCIKFVCLLCYIKKKIR